MLKIGSAINSRVHPFLTPGGDWDRSGIDMPIYDFGDDLCGSVMVGGILGPLGLCNFTFSKKKKKRLICF